ncbi:TetR/AcrR family transcriptional regulator [Actinokineospora diospyrosa]|uniref:Transcriptional regulator, TetR family n=1 Tax=Actinokineospora diospyrosa TaxID=103728 RepID=A0ABT1I849_9PSEU|nr:TetR/AcrR family transcriptional regulator [Actinokineospora diospyrosa]MCP2268787.1 transcriptional regulator, TetR family [Actinokineospora diospyrosa]
MDRLSRAQTRERNRGRILVAARAEFLERGYQDAKVDGIAARAGLTRGAVYSNFPGKRALYLEVLAERAERVPERSLSRPEATLVGAVGAFAHTWVSRLDETGYPLADIVGDATLPYTQLQQLNALLLGLAMERLEPPASPAGAPPARRVRQAGVILTTLYGARALAPVAPGFAEPFDVISACEHLAGLSLNDWWSYPYAAAPALPVDKPWTAVEAVDLVSGEPFAIEDGVVAVLGTHRLMAVEEALRLGERATLVVVTGQPAELYPLARLVIAEASVGLRRSFRDGPAVRVVCDERIAALVGITAVSDATEVAVLVRGGRVVTRAEGIGACHAVAGPRAVRV